MQRSRFTFVVDAAAVKDKSNYQDIKPDPDGFFRIPLTTVASTTRSGVTYAPESFDPHFKSKEFIEGLIHEQPNLS